MKNYLTILFTLVSVAAWAQQDTGAKKTQPLLATYLRHTTIATISLGFIDDNRRSYDLPTGFSKGNVSGFIPFFAKIEYGLTDNISLGATFGYDVFVYNLLQNYNGNNGAFNRYKTNNTRILSAGITGFYHLGKALHSKHFDPFIGLGISLNNIRYRAYPEGDSTAIKFDHTVTPYLKAGARYFISDKFSIFGDAGYDKQAIISLGFSCRFYNPRRL
jgi:outer membrane protein W